MTWLQRWWKWLLVGLGLIGVFLAGFFSRRPKAISPIDDSDDKKKKLEEAADKEIQEAATVRDTKLAEIAKQHDEQLTHLVDEQKKETPALAEDLNGSNEWLKQVGRNQRR